MRPYVNVQRVVAFCTNVRLLVADRVVVKLGPLYGSAAARAGSANAYRFGGALWFRFSLYRAVTRSWLFTLWSTLRSYCLAKLCPIPCMNQLLTCVIGFGSWFGFG